MTKITINKLITTHTHIDKIKSVSFDYMGSKMYSATNIDRITGVFISDKFFISDTMSHLYELKFNGTSTNHNIALFIKNSKTLDGLNNSEWHGPFYDTSNNVEKLTHPYCQTMAVMTYSTINPIINSIFVSFVAKQTASKFFTKSFDIGFSPTTILLTYNATKDNDSLIKFAISAKDTVDTNFYQYINPNQIEDIINLSSMASTIKLMIEFYGTSGLPLEINNVGVVFGGEQEKNIS